MRRSDEVSGPDGVGETCECEPEGVGDSEMCECEGEGVGEVCEYEEGGVIGVWCKGAAKNKAGDGDSILEDQDDGGKEGGGGGDKDSAANATRLPIFPLSAL